MVEQVALGGGGFAARLQVRTALVFGAGRVVGVVWRGSGPELWELGWGLGVGVMARSPLKPGEWVRGPPFEEAADRFLRRG